MIAGAITLREYPVFWRDVDGTTHGPLNDYVLLLAPFLGWPLDVSGGRFVGTLLLGSGLIGAWLAAQAFFNSTIARLALLPGLVLWGGTTFFDFFQYSSEMASIGFIGLGGGLGATGVVSPSPRCRKMALLIAGLLLGAIPYAKLQGVPLAAGIGILMVLLAWCRVPAGERSLSITLLVGGALIPSLIVAVGLTGFGLWSNFREAYVRSNMIYASDKHYPSLTVLSRWFTLTDVPDFAAFQQGVLLAGSVLLLPALLLFRQFITPFLITSGIVMLAIICVITPGRQYPHYLHFLVATTVPLLACLGHFAHLSLVRFYRAPGWVPIALLPLLALAAPIRYRIQDGQPFARRFPEFRANWTGPVGQRLLPEIHPGDRLAVWGWQPSY